MVVFGDQDEIRNPQLQGASRTASSLEAAAVEEARARHLTVAVAESLTGGGLAAAIVSVPGASEIFLGGIVSYAASLKERLLGVPPELIAAQGTVNAAVAAQMAVGVRHLLGADVSLSTTGVAGPGSNEGHAAGTVFIGYSDEEGTVTEQLCLKGSRSEIRQATADAALSLLLRQMT